MGTAKLHKEGKNVACVCACVHANAPHFSIVNSYPFPKSCIRPCPKLGRVTRGKGNATLFNICRDVMSRVNAFFVFLPFRMLGSETSAAETPGFGRCGTETTCSLLSLHVMAAEMNTYKIT